MARTNVVNAFDDTLTATFAAGASLMLVDNPASFPMTPFYAVIEPFNDGNREYVKATGIELGGFLVQRNLAGSVGDVEHLSGATVRVAIMAQHIGDIWDELEAGGGDFLPLDGSIQMTNTIGFNVTVAGLKYKAEGGTRVLMNAVETRLASPDGTRFVQVKDDATHYNNPINMTNKGIINLLNPVDPQDAATKDYVDNAGGGGDFLPLTGGTLTGDLNFNVSQTGITYDALRRIRFRSSETRFYTPNGTNTGMDINATGVVIFGNLAMGGNRVVNLAAPVDATDAVTKAWVEANFTPL